MNICFTCNCPRQWDACYCVLKAVVVAVYGHRASRGGMKDLVSERYPKTVEAAVDKLLAGMTFQDKTRVANMGPEKLVELHRAFGGQIQLEFRLPGNDPLMKSCGEYTGLSELSGEQASYILLKILWAKLQTSNVLKVVK